MYFDLMQEKGFEQLLFCQDSSTGLRAIIAIHSTVLGPSLGGCRFYPYPDEQAALTDVMRLAEGMTYKSAAAGVDLGGGKAVIVGNPDLIKSEALLRMFARHVDSLGGRYITAEDVGTNCADMDMIRRETPWVMGVSKSMGGGDDPSPFTSLGVLKSMQAAAKFRWGNESLQGKRVVVQGAGKVGKPLVRLLIDAGAVVMVSDTNQRALEVLKQWPCEVVEPDDVLQTACDIFAPCALGGVLTPQVVEGLKCEVICGSANNQLATEDVAELIESRGMLYVPDFIANAGGLMNVAVEIGGYNHELAVEKTEALYDSTLRILQSSADAGISPDAGAHRYAQARLEEVGRISRMRI